MNKLSDEDGVCSIFCKNSFSILYVKLIVIVAKSGVGLIQNSYAPIFCLFFCTGSQGINQYHLQKLDNRIIDFDAVFHLYTKIDMGRSSVFYWNLGLKPFHMNFVLRVKQHYYFPSNNEFLTLTVCALTQTMCASVHTRKDTLFMHDMKRGYRAHLILRLFLVCTSTLIHKSQKPNGNGTLANHTYTGIASGRSRL